MKNNPSKSLGDDVLHLQQKEKSTQKREDSRHAVLYESFVRMK
jgi:hypothetical protein